MISWSMLALEDDPDALEAPIASVPAWKRLILTLQHSGIENFLLLAPAGCETERLREELVRDERFCGRAFWLEPPRANLAGPALEIQRAPFLLVVNGVLHDPLLLRRFIITTSREDPRREEKFALADARRPYLCPSMEGITVTPCYWRTRAPVAFCPAHVFHPVDFAGVFVCPPALATPLVEAWRAGGRQGLSERLARDLESGCKGYLVAGKYRLWRLEHGERGHRKAEAGLVAQLRAYRQGRLERSCLGRFSGWLALRFARQRRGRGLLAAGSVASALLSAFLFMLGGYWAGVAAAASATVAVAFKLAVDDLARIRLERGPRIGGLAMACDWAAKLVPLAAISGRTLVERADFLSAAAGVLAIAGYFVAANVPTKRVVGRLRRLRRHLRGHAYLYVLGLVSLAGRTAWFLWFALGSTWLLGMLGWVRRRHSRRLTGAAV